MANKKTESRKIAENRKAFFNYHILESFEAGISLLGSEVKSLRHHSANLADAHCDYRENSLVLLNMHIPEYKGANRFNHEPKRARKLLLHKNEIKRLLGKLQVKGFSIIPLSLYFNARGIVKVQLAIGQGKKLFDKRETEKRRDWDREKHRLLKK